MNFPLIIQCCIISMLKIIPIISSESFPKNGIVWSKVMNIVRAPEPCCPVTPKIFELDLHAPAAKK